MMKAIVKWWRIRRLRKAQEKYACWKARHESLSYSCRHTGGVFWEEARQIAHAAAEEARYAERVEFFMTQQIRFP